MSRYMWDLVMRSLGEVGGLSPRPLNRYEPGQWGGASESTDVIQEMNGMGLPLESGRSFPDDLSRTVLPMMDAGPAEIVVHPARQTDTYARDDRAERLVEGRWLAQQEISGERNDEADVAKAERTPQAGRPASPTRISGHSNGIQVMNLQIPPQAEASASAQRPPAQVASPERRDRRMTESVEEGASSDGTRSGARRSLGNEQLPSPVTTRPRSSDPLEPTLGDLSVRDVRREATAPPVAKRPPVVQIRIGRIEVRAVEPPVSAPSKKVVEAPRSSVPLDQYLRRRTREA